MTDLENIRARLKNTTSDLLWACYRFKQKSFPKCEKDGALDWVKIQAAEKKKPDFRYLIIVSNSLEAMKQRDEEDVSSYMNRVKDHNFRGKLNEISQSLAEILERI